jgi:hypothetical protein
MTEVLAELLQQQFGLVVVLLGVDQVRELRGEHRAPVLLVGVLDRALIDPGPQRTRAASSPLRFRPVPPCTPAAIGGLLLP